MSKLALYIAQLSITSGEQAACINRFVFFSHDFSYFQRLFIIRLCLFRLFQHPGCIAQIAVTYDESDVVSGFLRQFKLLCIPLCCDICLPHCKILVSAFP